MCSSTSSRFLDNLIDRANKYLAPEDGSALRWSLRLLHVLLSAIRAIDGVPLIEGDSFGIAHQSKLDINAIEELGRESSCIVSAFRNGLQFYPVFLNEFPVVLPPAWIKELACSDEVQYPLLL
jgi:hypothetical protein